ncbi:MAG: bacterial Ig-like domain-containing protein [Caryophanon sp.]|nr:bacterial Ig-like domain-containing protein [Caryophanon sp.]
MQKTLKAAVAAALLTPPIVLTNVADAEAATVFKDVPNTQTHYDNIMQLYHEKVINGYEDGTFRPNERVTRGQAAKILAGVLGLIKPEDTYTGPNPNFKDVPVTHSYYKYIAVLAQAGIINGYPDGTYRTGNTLTRGQMAKIIYNGFNLDKFPDVSLPFIDVREDDQYYEQIKSLYALGVTVGKTERTYASREFVTRGQLASFVMRARHVEDKAIEVKVQNIIGNKLVTNKGTYTIGRSLQNVLMADNVRALTGADLQVYVSNNLVVGVQSIELNARGSEVAPIVLDGSEGVFTGDIFVKSEYVELSNMTVDGDVVLNGVNSGSRRTAKFITFNKVNVTGTTTAKDDFSGSNTSSTPATEAEEMEVTVSNSDIGLVSIEREHVTFVNDTPLRHVTVHNNVSAFSLYGDIGILEAKFGDVEVKGSGMITTFNYRGKGVATISLRGRVGNLNVTTDEGRTFIGQYTLVDILAKHYKRELVDVLVNIDEAETRIHTVTDYGKESNGMQSLEDLIIYTTRTDRTFYEGEALDPTEFVVQGVYADGTLKRQHINASNITGYKPNVPGAQTIKITVDGISQELNINVVAMSSIRIVTNPTKTMYRVGDAFSTAGIVVEGTYANGTVRREAITTAHASGFDLTRTGTQNVTIRVNNRTVSYPIRVVEAGAPVIEWIAVTKEPSTTKYYQGEQLSLNGLTITGTYTDGTKRTETVTAADVTGYDPMQPGRQTVSVNINGFRATFDVEVIEMTDLVLKSVPTQKEYRVGEALNTNGLQVIARYADGRESAVSLAEAKITGFNSERSGAKNVRLTYNGRAVSFQVDVLNVERIAVSKLPNKVMYFPGDALDLEGLEIQAQYSDQSTRIFSGSLASASGFNPNLVGDQVITLTYDGQTTQFKVRVLPLLSLNVEQRPTKTVYKEGEELDLTGLKVIGTYEGNLTREEQITKSMISGYDASAHGTEQKVTITIGNIETTFDVTVSKSPLALTKIVVNKLPDRVRYRVGIPFSIEGLSLTGLYNDNTTGELSLTDPNLKISTIDTSKPGIQQLTFEYGAVKESVDIEVYESTLLSLNASTTKATYAKGEEFNKSTVMVKANFDDGVEDLKEEDFEVTGYDKTKVGEQTLTITYRDQQTTLKVNVNENDVRSFTVNPDTVFLTQGATVDVTKLQLHVTLDNAAGEKQVVVGTPEDVTVSPFDNSKIGVYTVNVSYRGKTAPITVRVVDAKTIVSIDRVELWWEKNGTHAKYPYSVISKADIDANNVYFKVMRATNGAGQIITDPATLEQIKISTVNFFKRGTTQADTTSAQVNATTSRLSVAQAADLDVHFTYNMGGVPLNTPYTYPLTMVSQREATTAELTSGDAVATTNSTNITQLARTITFNVLDQVGERFDLPMNAPYYTLTKTGSTEGAAAPVTSYANGIGAIATNLSDAGTYTLRLYTAANKAKQLGEFPLTVKKIAVPAAADQYDYEIAFESSKRVLDVANYEWANGYNAAPTKTDALNVRVQAFVEGVEVAMPSGANVKLKSGAAMTLDGKTVRANNNVQPASDTVVVMVGTKEMAASPAIQLMNTKPKFDVFTVRENVDIFKYFTADDDILMQKLRNGTTLTAAEKAVVTQLVGRALRDVWSLSHEEAINAVKAVDVIATPTSSSADGSRKTTAINVTMHKMFTEAGLDKVVTVNGDYIEAWMSEAAATLKKAAKTPATFTVMLDDVRVDEVQASTIEINETYKRTETTIPHTTSPEGTVVNGVPIVVDDEPVSTPVFDALTFDEQSSADDTYKNRSDLEAQLAELSHIFTITSTSSGLRFTLKEGLKLTNEKTDATKPEKTIVTREDTTYTIQTNARAYVLSHTSRSVDIPFADLFTAYTLPSKITIGGQTFKFSSQAGPVNVERLEDEPKFSNMTNLAALINDKLSATYKAEALNDQLKLSTVALGAAANVNLNNAVKINDLQVVTEKTEGATNEFKTPWTVGLDESYVGNLVLTFSQAVALPETNEDFIIRYTTGDANVKELKIDAANVAEVVTVSGTTVTVKMDGLAQAADFGDPTANIEIESITGLKAVKGYYEKNVKSVYNDVTVTLQ